MVSLSLSETGTFSIEPLALPSSTHPYIVPVLPGREGRGLAWVL